MSVRRSAWIVALVATVAACGSNPAPTVPAASVASMPASSTAASAAPDASSPDSPSSPGPVATATTPSASGSPGTSPAPGQGPDPNAGPLIWFAPLPPLGERTDLPFADGSADYFDLFAPGARWVAATRAVGVFKIYSSWVDNYATDEQLRQVVEGTAARGQALAVEIGALSTSAGCGTGVEGFDASLQTLDRIRAAGGTVSLVAFDEPYAFGHAYAGAGACRWTVEQVARAAAEFTLRLRAAWPGIRVGDTEPLWPEIGAGDLGAWLDAYRAAAGAPFDFLHLDADWSRTDWPQRAAAAARAARSRAVPVGMIYNGGDAASDGAWAQAARDHVDAFERALGGAPDQVVFQSWMDHPDHALPDNDPSTFTGLIRQYAGARSGISIERLAGDGRVDLVGGVIDRATDAGLPGATVKVTAVPLGGAYQVSALDGRVPAGATTAVIALRANTEGAGPGPVDLRVYRVAYTERGGTRNRVPDPAFAAGGGAWGVSGSGRGQFLASDHGGGRMLRVRTGADQTLLVDSRAFAVTAGARYRFTAAIRVPAGTAGNAYLAVVFLHGTEVERQRLALAPAPITLGTARSTVSGRFALRSRPLTPGRYRLVLSEAGDPDRWPASLETQIRIR